MTPLAVPSFGSLIIIPHKIIPHNNQPVGFIEQCFVVSI